MTALTRSLAAALGIFLTLIGGNVAAGEQLDVNAYDAAAVTGLAVRVDGGPASTSIQIADLYPGATRQAVILLDGPGASSIGRLAIEFHDLVDHENGCNGPELHAGDTSCGNGPDEGELSQWLQVRMFPGIETGDDRGCSTNGAPAVAGVLHDLADTDEPSVLRAATDPGPPCAVLGFHHLDLGLQDNLTQTDSVDFSMTVHFEGGGGVLDEEEERINGEDRPRTDGGAADAAGGTGSVDGQRLTVPTEVTVAGRSGRLGLAFTGGPIGVLFVLSAATLLAGAALLRRHEKMSPAVGP